MLPFGKLLFRYLKRKPLGVREFARIASVPPSMVTKLHTAKCPMPMKRVGEWADLLDLSAHERKEFTIAAGLTHAPAEVHGCIVEIQAEVRTLRRKYAELERRLAAELARRKATDG